MGTAGRKDRYETHVKPKLDKVKEWVGSLNEGQIAKKLGINPSTFQRYKTAHPELAQALIDGIEDLKVELKDTLKKKAKGFNYTETKTTIRKDESGKEIKTIERYEKYAQPDTGAIHLLLKNIDPNWKNDDDRTYELKKKQVEIAEKKADDANW